MRICHHIPALHYLLSRKGLVRPSFHFRMGAVFFEISSCYTGSEAALCLLRLLALLLPSEQGAVLLCPSHTPRTLPLAGPRQSHLADSRSLVREGFAPFGAS